MLLNQLSSSLQLMLKVALNTITLIITPLAMSHLPIFVLTGTKFMKSSVK